MNRLWPNVCMCDRVCVCFRASYLHTKHAVQAMNRVLAMCPPESGCPGDYFDAQESVAAIVAERVALRFGLSGAALEAAACDMDDHQTYRRHLAMTAPGAVKANAQRGL